MGRNSRLDHTGRPAQLSAVLHSGLLCACLVGAFGSACKHTTKPPPPEPQEPAAPAPDRLTPGQLIEGDVAIFGLQLPEGSTVKAAFRESANVAGAYRPEDLAVYLKPRLDVAHMEMAGNKIIFPKVRVRGGDGKVLRIEIFPSVTGCELRLRDVTPPIAEPGLSEEERWRKAGMKPNGELLDPNGME